MEASSERVAAKALTSSEIRTIIKLQSSEIKTEL